MIFPSDNLPTSSKPWAREVTKQLSNVIDMTVTNDINNTARDNQLNSSIIAASAAATAAQDAANAAADAAAVAGDAAAAAGAAAADANEAINGLLGLGSEGSGYTLNVSNITSGNARDGVLNITSGSNSSIDLYNGGVDLNGPGSTISVGQSGNGSILISSTGGINIGGTLRVEPYNIRATGITASGFMQSENYAGGGTTGASINNNGTIIRTSSSARYKQDISDLSVDYDAVLSLQPKRFKLKDEAAESPDARYYAGFIAEEIDQTTLKDFVAYGKDEDGNIVPDGVYYGELTAALVSAIKHQDSLIKQLIERVAALENNQG